MTENFLMDGWEDDEYKAFVAKFKAKKTTDDCYTPPAVYDAIAEWVSKEYGIQRSNFVRPFYPGGDYQHFPYGPQDVVVDNPPFSILSQIITWYTQAGIRFFLFAPTLTLFGGSTCAALPCGVVITFENGAKVNTSFLTNLEPDEVQIRTVPELYRIVDAANKKNVASQKTELPKYIYPDALLTAAAAYRLCKYGVSLTVKRQDCLRIPALDAQRKAGKSIFGCGGKSCGGKSCGGKSCGGKSCGGKSCGGKMAAQLQGAGNDRVHGRKEPETRWRRHGSGGRSRRALWCCRFARVYIRTRSRSMRAATERPESGRCCC